MTWSKARPPGVSSSTRRRILARDDGRCYVCGLYGAEQVDHVKPRSEGGSDHDSNLAAIHAQPCHARKSEAERLRGMARRSRKRKPEAHPGYLP